jgi:hypothetical protein
VFAVDEEWSGDADGYLCHTQEVFNVAGQNGRVEGILAEMREVRAGLVVKKLASAGGHAVCVIVVPVAGDACGGV